MSALQYFIATTVNDRQYVVLRDNKVVAGPFATAKEAIAARENLVNAGAVVAKTSVKRVKHV